LKTEKTYDSRVLNLLNENSDKLHAWCVLPNHYHALLTTRNVLALLKKLSQFHGRTSFLWNGEENKRGRRIWCNTLEKTIKSDRHFWASMNYIHHNPVKHGYVDKWTDWPYSSAKDYLEAVGRRKALENWTEYDISEMGKDWDEYGEHAKAVNSNGGK
jgi:putative transposase